MPKINEILNVYVYSLSPLSKQSL